MASGITPDKGMGFKEVGRARVLRVLRASAAALVRHDLLREPARILMVEPVDVSVYAYGAADAAVSGLPRRGTASVPRIVDGASLAVVPLDGKRAYMAVLVHAGSGEDAALPPS